MGGEAFSGGEANTGRERPIVGGEAFSGRENP